jgi:hypothetical protein
MNPIRSANLPPDSINRRPSIKLAALTKREALDQFKGTFEWFLAEVIKR